jgi:Trk K+ transport system NAD-binding subunit
MAEEQDIVDVEVRNPDLHGVSLRDLKLPLDALILSIQRDGHAIISHGYTQLHLGDIVTMVGNRQVLNEVALRFEA